MIVGSLFSGVGGLDHGLANAGFEHAFLCEADDWRREVLRARFPGVPIYADVRSLGEPTGRVAPDDAGASIDLGWWEAGTGLLSGGFPCQDISVAGQRRGLAGNRSGLFYEFARIIDALRPRWVLVENVPGLFSSNGGRDFGAVVGTLADFGYGLGWRVLDSRFFGVPQRRRRVFILGTVAVGDPRAAAERAGQVLAVGTRCDRHPPTGREAGEDAAVASLSGLGNGGPDDNDGQAGRLVADTVRSHPRPGSNSNGNLVTAFAAKGGGGGSFHEDDISPTLSAHGDNEGGQPPGVALAGAVRRLTPTECERLQALPDGWTNPDGTAPDSRRYAALGDAVTSSVGEWIGRRILMAETVSLEAVSPTCETAA